MGQLLNPNATSNCEYCRFAKGDAYLATLNMYWSQRWRNFGIFCALVPLFPIQLIFPRYIVFNFFAIFFLFYLTRISPLERKKSTKKTLATRVKETVLTAGHAFENIFIRKNDAGNDKQGVDHSMNSANFAIFQGAGLETLDSRGLGRQWTRRSEYTD